MISHRGLKNKFPENSIGAFKHAQEVGFDWIELDLIATKNGDLVCSHNFDLERETCGRGYITELTTNALKPIIKEHNYLLEGSDILPELKSVLDSLSSNMKINIEIKSSHVLDLFTARALGKIIKNLPIDRILISCFNPIVIFYFKLFYRNIKTAFLYQNIEYFWVVNWIHPSYIHPRADLISPDLIKYAKRKNLGIHTWTVNNTSAIEWCKKQNIDGIITDLGVIK